MEIDQLLYNYDEAKYGAEYKAHLLDMYKIYLEMADRISSRRQSANNFYLAINTALIGLVGYLRLGAEKSLHNYFLISAAGMVLCYIWYRQVRSYRGMSSGKFKIVHKLEKKLPISLYDAEWEILGRGKTPDIYLPFTRIEIFVPWVFFLLHFFVFIVSMPWKECFA
jgi:hypothetical protein